MFVLTAKISKTKLIALGLLLLAVIALIVVLAGSNGSTDTAPNGTTNDDRVAYLATFGWSVNATPTQTQKVRIPESNDNRVFSRYNELQISQGFDLTKYAGQDVMRYVYEILNYPEADAPIFATVLVSDGRIIGGDITNSASDGVIHGFKKPAGTKTEEAEATTQAPSEAAVAEEASEEPASTTAGE